MNIYILSYKYHVFETEPGVITFTNKALAKDTARYYRDTLKCEVTTLRHDQQSSCGWCNIIGFIDF